MVDSFSADGTLDIAPSISARVIQHEYVHSATQKNWAIPQFSHEWVLQIDSDEVLEAGAKEEILARIASANDVHAFALPGKNYVLGQCLRTANLYSDL